MSLHRSQSPFQMLLEQLSFPGLFATSYFSVPEASTVTSTTPRLVERLRMISSGENSKSFTDGSGNSKDDGTTSNLQSSKESSVTTTTTTATLTELLVELGITLGLAILSSYLITTLTRSLFKGVLPDEQDPNTPASTVYSKLYRILKKRQSMHSPTVVAGRRRGSKIQIPHLSPRELQMADEILDPDDIECSFSDIGGLDATKQEIYELAVLPLVRPELFGTSKLAQPTKGILLYGKPGTGKTMLAKALAKESEAIFLPLQLSKILNKYWGESNKLIAATFTLAHKLQPCVIFIDELDTFLKNTNSETAYMDSIKAEFLTMWDGVATSSTSRVLVLGATNQPQNIDSAILRRMPRAFEVPLPDAAGRLAILQLLLEDEHIDPTVDTALPHLVDATKGYSGSDLKELCRAAAMVPIHERTADFARQRVMGQNMSVDTELLAEPLRPMCDQDLLEGLKKVRRTGDSAQQYGRQSQREQQTQQETSSPIDIQSLQNIATLLRSLSQLSATDQLSEDEIPNLSR